MQGAYNHKELGLSISAGPWDSFQEASEGLLQASPGEEAPLENLGNHLNGPSLSVHAHTLALTFELLSKKPPSYHRIY